MKTGKFLKHGFKTAVRAGVVFAFALGFLFVYAQTDGGKNRIVTFVETAVNSLTGFTIKIEALEGWLPFDMRAEKVTIADQRGEWFMAEKFHLEWTPFPLLHGKIKIIELSANRLNVIRAPEMESDNEDAPTSAPVPRSRKIYFPSVSIDKLSIARLFLGQKITGEDAAFSIQGYGAGEAETVQSGAIDVASGKFEIRRLDKPGLAATLSAELTNHATVLSINGKITEERGGIIASALHLRKDAPLALSITGTAPVKNWKGRVECYSNGDGLLDIAIGMVYADDESLAATADGFIKIPGYLLPPELAPYLDKKNNISIAVKAPPEMNKLSIEHALVVTQIGSARVTGNYDIENMTVASSFDVDIDSLTPIGEALNLELEGTVKIHGTADGPENAPIIRVESSVVKGVAEVFEYTDAATTATITPIQGALANGVTISGNIAINGMAFPASELLPFKNASGTFDLVAMKGRDFEIKRLDARDGDITASFVGKINGEGVARGTLNAESPKIERFSNLFRSPISGSLIAKGSVEWAMLDDKVNGEVSGVFKNFAGFTTIAGYLAAPETKVEGGIRFADKIMLINDVRMISPNAAVNGAGAVYFANDTFKTNLRGVVKDISVMAPGQGLAGQGRVEATIGGGFVNVGIMSRAVVDNFAVRGTAFDGAEAGVTIKNIPDAISGAGEVALMKDKIKYNATTGFALGKGMVKLTDTSIKTDGLNAAGEFVVKTDTMLVDGTANVTADNLYALAPFINEKIAGATQTQMKFSASGGDQNATVNLTGTNIATRFGAAEKIVVAGDMTDILRIPKGKVDAQVYGYRRGKIRVAQAFLNAEGSVEKSDFSISGKGNFGEEFELETGGSLEKIKDGVAVRLAKFTGVAGDHPVKLTKPFSGRFFGAGFGVENLSLDVANGKINAAGYLTPEKVDIYAEFAKLPLSLLRLVGAPEMLGAADGKLAMAGTPGNPDVKLNLFVENAAPADPSMEDVILVKMDTGAELKDGRMTARIDFSSKTNEKVNAQATIPFKLSLAPFSFSVPRDGEVNGLIGAYADLKDISAILALDQQVLAGWVSGNLKMNGTVSSPKFSGGLDIKNGAYENTASGTYIKDINGSLIASDNTIAISRLVATDGGSGKISATGSMSLEPGNGTPFSVQFNLDKAMLVRRDDINAGGSGEITFGGDKKSASVKGKLNLKPVEIFIPDRIVSAVPDLNVEEINVPAKQQKPPKEKKPKTSDWLKLDVNLAATEGVFARGQGLDSEWRSALQIGGTPSAPSIKGDMNLIRGRFDFFGKTLNLTTGLIKFDGATPISPSVDIAAQGATQDMTATLSLTGEIAAPSIKLDSTPKYPSDEILSRLLFGKRMSEISALQAVQLAQAVRSLTGTGKTIDFLSHTRKLLKVDDLKLSQSNDATKDVTIGVGKYIRDDVFLKVDKNLQGSGGKVSVEVEVSPNVNIETQAGADASSGIGINWKYDY